MPHALPERSHIFLNTLPMFDQELREGERRKEGESFKKFAGRRLLVALITLVVFTLVVFFWFLIAPIEVAIFVI